MLSALGEVGKFGDENVDGVVCCYCQFAVAGEGDGALDEGSRVEGYFAEGEEL